MIWLHGAASLMVLAVVGGSNADIAQVIATMFSTVTFGIG